MCVSSFVLFIAINLIIVQEKIENEIKKYRKNLKISMPMIIVKEKQKGPKDSRIIGCNFSHFFITFFFFVLFYVFLLGRVFKKGENGLRREGVEKVQLKFVRLKAPMRN